MSKNIPAAVVLFFWAEALIPAAAAQSADAALSEKMRAFFQKPDVTIAVTDSGLGGLSVMADAAARMKTSGVFRSVRFVFFNALFSTQGGYNTLKTKEAKAEKFDEALGLLNKRYKPDVILIACNTLSLVYDATKFSKAAGPPVVPITGAATELMLRTLRRNPAAVVLIFGTPTTISDGTYSKNLKDAGIAPNRIFDTACPELELFIERDPSGFETELLISGFIDEALFKLPNPRPPFVASLNCTHYGYSLSLWKKAFQALGENPLAMINPNERMADVLFPKEFLKRYPKTNIRAEAVSRTDVPQPTIDTLSAWLEKKSPEVAEALKKLRLKKSGVKGSSPAASR